MAMRVLYLDVDDEITSAASRTRSAEEIRIAVVLPYGSRIATSRINFRLLAHDATMNGKRLSIIAGDAATRALAASAGLPTFASVAEYESALAAEKAEKAGTYGGPSAAPPVMAATAQPAAEPATAETTTESPQAVDAPADEKTGSGVRANRPARGGPRRTASKPSPDAAAAGAAAIAASEVPAPPFITPAEPGERAPRPVMAPVTPEPETEDRPAARPLASVPEARPASRAPSVVPAARVIADTPSRPAILDRPFGPLATRMPIVIGVAVLALAVLVGGIGAYVLLPTATVVITPRQASIGPIELRITANPVASEPDQAAKIVPASTVDVDVAANGTFNATGKRVEEVEAKGTVRFRNFDANASNTIPRGSIVSTRSGVRFRTDKAVTVKRAEQILFQVFPSSATVTVTAVQGGPEGNVGADSIRVIPRGEDPQTLDVTNPAATGGGKREEFARIAQADVNKAMAALRDQLTTKFQGQVAEPAVAGEDRTAFPETAVLGEPTFTVDPATLVGDEVKTFDLGASATGTVMAVDEGAVTTVAGADIATHVEPGYSLVEGSSRVEASPGIVEGGVIMFPVVITAKQVLQLDTAAIEAEIRGKPLDEAQAILQRYGTPQISVWPDWVGSIPTLDARVEVRSSSASPATP